MDTAKTNQLFKVIHCKKDMAQWSKGNAELMVSSDGEFSVCSYVREGSLWQDHLGIEENGKIL